VRPTLELPRIGGRKRSRRLAAALDGGLTAVGEYRRSALTVSSLDDAAPQVASSLDVQQVLTEIVGEAVSLLKAETGSSRG
jgi:hypothetical protein